MPPVSSPGSGTPTGHPHLGPPAHRGAGRLPSDSHEAALARVRFRRALTLLAMTLVLPGSAQLVAGRRNVGRIALRVWLSVVGMVACLVLLGLAWQGFVYWLASSTVFLGALRLLLSALAVGWALLFLDAWRLGRPLELRQRHRLAVVGLNGVLCFAVAGSLLFASHLVAVQKGIVSTMFGDGAATAADRGRFNVLLLGGDSGAGRWGLRPDSITVASIDADTGRTILFGLPRNMMNFPFAKGSVMAQQFPRGYTCSTCELNSLVTWANDNRALFKRYGDPGVEATTEAVQGITGLRINYWAMVNLAGFRRLVNAVGGLTLTVRDRIPIGAIGDFNGRYVKAGTRRLNGFETLWFARSRMAADDYSRMARQKCVMNAMLQQLSVKQVVLKFGAIADAGKAMLRTNIPGSELDRFMQLAVKARRQPIRTVSFVPPQIATSRPDIAKVRAMVRRAVGASEGTRKAPASSTARVVTKRGTPTGGTTGGSFGNIQDGYAANQSRNLGASC